VVNGMFSGCAFFMRLKAKREFIVRVARMNLEYKAPLIAESEVKE
jgi:hypothetical protein